MSDLDEVTLYVFTTLEDMPVMVQQHDFHNDVPCPPYVEGCYTTPTGMTMVRVHHRREFLIIPKTAAKPTSSKKEKPAKEVSDSAAPVN